MKSKRQISKKSLWVTFLTILFVITVLGLPHALLAQQSVDDDPNEHSRKQNLDAFAESPIRRALSAEEHKALKTAAKPGTKVHLEDRLAVPTFLWAAQPGNAVAAGSGKGGKLPEEVAARQHLPRHAALYRLSQHDIDSATVASIHNTGRGTVIVKFRQSIGGIEVFREELNVIMRQNLELIGISGYLASADASSPAFSLGPSDAVARAFSDLLDTPFTPEQILAAGSAGGYGLHTLSPEAAAANNLEVTDPARAKRVLYRLPDRIEPGYYVEVNAAQVGAADSLAYSYVISAVDGQVLFRNNLTADQGPPVDSTPFSYRVWADSSPLRIPHDGPQGSAGTPHPTGLPDGFQPPFILPNLITLASGPISTKDPWLPAGATRTIGNNVEAYADLAAPDGFTPNSADTHAFTTGPNTFDRTYDTALGPKASGTQTQAAVTQLFYTINFLHDWFYDSGFDEASGNAQTNNYGRGGIEGDSLRADAQDFNGRNNANMSVPADGGRPRMQVFIGGGISNQGLTVNSPSSLAGDYPVGIAAFGPQSFQVTGDIVVANDGVSTPSDGCETPFVNAAAVSGKIALIDRGICGFAQKVKNAQLNGAIGVIIANNTTDVVDMGGSDLTIVIGALSVSLPNGNAIKNALQSGPVNAALLRESGVDRDWSLDNQIVAHEWGHYISNRLVSNSFGLGTAMARGLGEGWADFHALLMTVKPEDALTAAGANFNGVYTDSGYASVSSNSGQLLNNAYYFGLRRVPYSTDFTKNALTFKHISTGVPLPSGVPTAFGGGPNNAEVHNTGEVWATMLWECYAALLRETLQPPRRLTFDKARDRMRDYLVAAYKMTPSDPTLLEARDALLAAARANDAKDFVLFWEAFARRGAGTGAIAPDRNSPTNSPVVESYVVGGALEFAGSALSDDQISCDRDGFLDNGETGRLFISLNNDGARLLTNTTAIVTSSNPAVTILDNSRVSFAATHPFDTATSFVRVGLNGASGIQQLDFTISFDDPDLDPIGPFTAQFQTRGGANAALNSSSSDNVESPVSAWTPVVNVGSVAWRREIIGTTPLNHIWRGPDVSGISDTSLVSPVLNVGSAPFTFSFRHRYQLESNFDGGVIEISTDGGATWTDIGTGYTGTLPTDAGNPLGGRPAFTGTSSGYPNFSAVAINLGTAYANKGVRIRFRIGSDIAVSGAGWDIDDFVFTGITNTPFHVLVADPGCR